MTFGINLSKYLFLLFTIIYLFVIKVVKEIDAQAPDINILWCDPKYNLCPLQNSVGGFGKKRKGKEYFVPIVFVQGAPSCKSLRTHVRMRRRQILSWVLTARALWVPCKWINWRICEIWPSPLRDWKIGGSYSFSKGWKISEHLSAGEGKFLP